jgi:hypothetical protein
MAVLEQFLAQGRAYLGSSSPIYAASPYPSSAPEQGLPYLNSNRKALNMCSRHYGTKGRLQLIT